MTSLYARLSAFSTAHFFSPFRSLLLICLLLIGGIALAQPANDLCSNAISIPIPTTLAGNNINATSTGDVGPNSSCISTASSDNSTVWYTVVGNGASLTASTCAGASIDTWVGVFVGTCNSLVNIACNDDACGLRSRVIWQSTAGMVYYVMVRGFQGARGTFTLVVTDGSIPPPTPAPCSVPIFGLSGPCSASGVTLVAVGGNSFSFSGPGIVEQFSGVSQTDINGYRITNRGIPTIGRAVVNQPGTYTVTATGDNGCTTSSSTTVYASDINCGQQQERSLGDVKPGGKGG